MDENRKTYLERAIAEFGFDHLESIRNWLNSRFQSNRRSQFVYGTTTYSAEHPEGVKSGPGNVSESPISTTEFSDFLISLRIDVDSALSVLNLCGWINGPFHFPAVAGGRRDNPIMNQPGFGGPVFHVREKIEPINRSELTRDNGLKQGCPLLVTEGKTDVAIIKTAWSKIYKDECPFEITFAGIQSNEDEREGGATRLRQQLEFAPATTPSPIIGLFDNDRAGNLAFQGLNKAAFSKWEIGQDTREGIGKSVWAMLLPVPEFRRKWVTSNDSRHRYLELEHYFSDAILEKENMKGSQILDSSVFQISGDKVRFSNSVSAFDAAEFEVFKLMFEQLSAIHAGFGI